MFAVTKNKILSPVSKSMVVSSCRLMARRGFADDAAAAVPAKRSGAGFFQRLSSFIVGAGIMSFFTHFYIHQEITEGNKIMITKQRELERRLEQLEKKK